MSTDKSRGDEADLVVEALALISRCGGLSSDQREKEIDDWRATSEAHAAAFHQAQAEWAVFGEAANNPLSGVERVRLLGEAAMAGAADYPARAVAAAIAILAIVAAPFVASQINVHGQQPTFLAKQRLHAPGHVLAATRYVTQRGEQREVELPNGARLLLNWNSEVLVAEVDGETHVDVLLGDALFSVPKSADAPLIVHAGDAIAYAPETEFAIHSHSPNDAFFQVKKGVVTIASREARAPKRLGQSEQSFFFNGVGGDIDKANLESIAAWRDGKLIFDEHPLVEVLYELAHYTERKLNVGPIANVSERITATFALEEADSALLKIADAYSLELVKTSPEETLVRSVDRRRL